MEIYVGEMQCHAEVQVAERNSLMERDPSPPVVVSPREYDFSIRFEITNNDQLDVFMEAIANGNPGVALQALSVACSQTRMGGISPSQILGNLPRDVTRNEECEPGCTDQPTGRRALDVGD